MEVKGRRRSRGEGDDVEEMRDVSATHPCSLSGQTAGSEQLDFNCPFESAELMCSCVTIAINVKHKMEPQTCLH